MADGIDFTPDHEEIAFTPDEPGIGFEGMTMQPNSPAAMQVLAKVLDYPRGAVTAPLIAKALERITGKKNILRGQEWRDAVNPLKPDTFPPADVLAERAGIPTGASASDVLPGLYSETGNEWLKFKKGGFLDPTVRGAGGIAADAAIDPLTYATAGGAAGVRALSEGGAAGRLANALKMAAKAPSEAIRGVGKSMYKGAFVPVEIMGERVGKKDIAETAYKYGIRGTGRQIQKQAGDVADRLINHRDAILHAADSHGPSVDLDLAMKEAQDSVDKMRLDKDPMERPIADAMQEKINEYKALAERPDQVIPAETATREVPSAILGPDGKPVMNSVTEVVTPEHVIPGEPGVIPSQASGFKSSLYNGMGSTAYNEAAKTKAGDSIRQKLARGLKLATEKSVGKTLGPAQEAELIRLNDEAGKLLGSQVGFQQIAEQADRKPILTGTDAIQAGIFMGTGAADAGVKSLAVKKGFDWLRWPYGRTQVGSRMRAVGESPWAANLMDTTARRKIVRANQTPWTLLDQMQLEDQ
jgi:hypothetical protein